jgi:hypothetical protein
MTKAERLELAKVVRMQAKSARARIDQRKAERLAQLEEELAAEYGHDDERWSAITEEALRLVQALDAELAEVCAAHGIRPEFRPKLQLSWYDRGENGVARRRAELRKVAVTRSEADAQRARAEVERWATAACTDLVARGLTTDEARGFLDAMPAADVLLPALELAELEAEAGGGGRR